MALTKITGPVSNFREETEVKSATSTSGAFGMGRTKFQTQKVVNFRVGNRPVSMKLSRGSIDLTDGDEATVVGTESNGGIKAVLVRNDVTGVAYSAGFWYLLSWGILMTIIGFATVGIVIGFLLAPVGIYMLYKSYQLKQAQAMLAA